RGVAGSTSTWCSRPLTLSLTICTRPLSSAGRAACPRLPHLALHIAPRRSAAEPGAGIERQRGELTIGERAAEAGHPRTGLAVPGHDAVEDDMYEIARGRQVDRRAVCELQRIARIRRDAAVVMAGAAGTCIDGRSRLKRTVAAFGTGRRT